MEFSIKTASPEKLRSACVAVGVFESRKLTSPAQAIDDAAQGYLSDILRRGDMAAKLGSTLLLYNVPGAAAERVLLVGLGKERDFHEKAYREAIAAALRALNETGAAEAVVFLTEHGPKKRDVRWRIRHAAMTSLDALYRFEQLKSKKDEAQRRLRKLAFAIADRGDLAAAEEALTQGRAIAEGMSLARELGNLPANICTPTYLAEQAKALARQLKLKAEVLDRAAMQKLGMGSLLCVADGSHEPPKLIVLKHNGAKAGDKPVVLVGKGITFDTGGISLKPAAEMDEMKFDMCGAAAVLGTLQGVRADETPAQCDRHRADDREHARRAAQPSQVTSSPRCPARPSRSSIPTPKAG